MSTVGGMTAGGSARSEAGKSAAIARHLNARASRFDRGARGERAVARMLDELTSSGYVVEHDLANPNGGNVDHVVVGPGGVFVFDTKHWAAETSLRLGRLRCGSRDVHACVESLDSLTTILSAQLGVPVKGALVIHDHAYPLAAARIGGVGMVLDRDVVGLLRSKPMVLTPPQVADISQRLVALLTPAPVAPPVPPRNNELDLYAPGKVSGLDATVRYRVYIARRWAKWGKSRTYLSSHRGEELGFIDVGTGRSSTTQAGDRNTVALLERLSDPSALPDPDIDDLRPRGALGGLFRQTSTAGYGHVVAVPWSKSGMRRIYFTLHVPGEGPCQLGHVDLGDGSTHSTDPKRTGLLTYAWSQVFDQFV